MRAVLDAPLSPTSIAFLALASVFAGCGQGKSSGVAHEGEDPTTENPLGFGSCDRGAIVAALAAASTGDVVEIRDCEVAGPLLIPAGVSLRGSGADASGVYGQGILITMQPGSEESPTRVADLLLRSDGDAGIRAEGDGHVALENLAIDVREGIGVGLDGVSATISGTSITGEVTEENAANLWGKTSSASKPWDVTTTHAVIALRSSLDIVDSVIDGFLGAGLLAAESSVAMSTTSFHGNLGHGIHLFACEATLADVVVQDTYAGGMAPELVSAVLVESGSVVTTDRLLIERGDGSGLYEIGSTGTHRNLQVREQALGGYWIANAESPTSVGGAASEFVDNALAGVVILNSASVTIADARIAGTTLATATIEGGMFAHLEGMEVTAAHGIHAVNSAPGLRLQDLFLEDNQALGIFLDYGGAPWSKQALSRVVIDGPTGVAIWLQNRTLKNPDDLFNVATNSAGTPVHITDENSENCSNLWQGGNVVCGGEDRLPTLGITTPNNIVTPNNLLESGLNPLW